MELIFVLLAVVWIVTSSFTAAHAMDHEKSALWGVAVLFFGVFGLIAYAISLASD